MSTRNKSFLTIKETTVFAVLGAMMYCTKVLMEFLPNIHLLGMFTITFTIVFRKKALIPIYVYVFLEGLFSGFSVWWLAYLYIWAILWGLTMLVPRKTPKKAAFFIYPALCCFHGLIFGVLYAPIWAIMAKMSWSATLAWIAAGLEFDLIHALSNFALGFLCLPLSETLSKIMNGRIH